MRALPSIPAAIVTGVVVMPVFVWGCHIIDTTLHSQSLVLVWAVIGFFAPVVLSTTDIRYALKRWRQVGFFGLMASREDFRLLYIPAWIRMGVWFVSAVIAMLVLKALGVNL